MKNNHMEEPLDLQPFRNVPPAGVTPNLTVTVTPYLSFRPNPIGVGQPLLINIWTTPPPAANRYLGGFTVVITNLMEPT